MPLEAPVNTITSFCKRSDDTTGDDTDDDDDGTDGDLDVMVVLILIAGSKYDLGKQKQAQ
jgi:hypothetical protein